ncbi:MAG: hypothetical protein MJ085_05325 [Clostridia bacterium]|nr:hypothetical protein [Clostridia bacterium]
MKKLIAILLVLVLAFGVFACSAESGGHKHKKEDEITWGSMQTWGRISVFVPDGYVLQGGNITGIDDTDETQCSIQPETPSFYDYYWIVITDAETAESNIEATKAINSGKNATVTAGDHEWKGVTYSMTGLNGSIDAGVVYSEIDGVVYQVTFVGHEPDSNEVSSVLKSIKAA